MNESRFSMKWLRPFIILASLVLVLALLYWMSAVLIPVALAVLLTFLLAPVVASVQRRGLGRAPAVILVVVLSGTLLAGLGWLVARQVTNLVDAFPAYEHNVRQKIAAIRSAGEGGFLEKLQAIFRKVTDEIEKEPSKPLPQVEEAKPQPVKIVDDGPFTFARLSSLAGPLVEPLASAGLIVILVIFMLIRREDVRDRLISAIGRGRVTLTTKALDDAGYRIGRYLLMQLIVNGSFGTAVGLGLFLIGIPHAALWGFLAAVLRYIPYLGPWLAALLPVGLSLLISESWATPLLVVGLFLVLELLSNLIMEPTLYGRNTGVSEAATLVTLAFWTWLWGPIGLILATPLTVCLVVLGKYVPALKFFDTLLGDQPVLEAPLGFYQRLLARDLDEAADIAEERLEAHPLEEVYDELLVPALTYARRDRDGDILTDEDQRLVLSATREIAEELGALGQSQPGSSTEAPADGNGVVAGPMPTILGVPARDEIDEAALTMLRELVEGKCEMTLTTTALLSSEVVALVEEKKPVLVCVAALPPGGLAHARLLCLRLKARFPDLKLLVGRWGLKGNLEKNRKQLLSAGAADVATTLGQTRSQMLTLLQTDGPWQPGSRAEKCATAR